MLTLPHSEEWNHERRPLGGGASSPLAGSISRLAREFRFEGDRMYWTDGRRILSMATSGGDVTTDVAGGAPSYSALDMDTSHFYVLRIDSGSMEVVAIDRVSSSEQVLASASVSITESGGPLVVDATHVYYGMADEIFRVSKSGGAPQFLADSRPASLAIDGSHLYWADFLSGGGINRVAKAGGMSRALSAGGGNPRRIALRGSHVYWVGYGAGLRRVQKTGGASERLASGRSSELVVTSSGAFTIFEDLTGPSTEVRHTGGL